MKPWALWGVTHIRKDEDNSRIIRVKVYAMPPIITEVTREFSREEVVELIEEETSFITVLIAEDGSLVEGDEIEVFPLNGEKFIRTDGNSTASDNLGELPRF